jgi:hypothetical protein
MQPDSKFTPIRKKKQTSVQSNSAQNNQTPQNPFDFIA